MRALPRISTFGWFPFSFITRHDSKTFPIIGSNKHIHVEYEAIASRRSEEGAKEFRELQLVTASSEIRRGTGYRVVKELHWIEATDKDQGCRGTRSNVGVLLWRGGHVERMTDNGLSIIQDVSETR